MLLWFCYLTITMMFIVVAFLTAHTGGLFNLVFLPAIGGCFILNTFAGIRMFFDPQRGFRSGILGCTLMVPLFLVVAVPTYGVPLVSNLLVIYYTKIMVRKDPTVERMQRFTATWRIKLVGFFWVPFITLLLVAFALGAFERTRNIFPIEGNAIVLWR